MHRETDLAVFLGATGADTKFCETGIKRPPFHCFLQSASSFLPFVRVVFLLGSKVNLDLIQFLVWCAREVN